MQSLRCWIIMIAGFVLATLAFQVVQPFVVSPQGAIGPTIFQAQTPFAGLVAVAAAIVVGVFIAAGTARLLSPLYGMAVLGLGIGWSALDWATMRDIIFHGSPELVAIDGLCWTVVVLVVAWVTVVIGRGVSDVHPDIRGERPDPLRSRAAIKQAACGLAALPVVWIMARSDLRGQGLGAVALGGVAAGMVGRMLFPHVQPILLPAATVLAGTLAGWVAAMMLPVAAGDLYVHGTFPKLLLPIPIDWAAGALVGVPVGFYFGGWFLRHEEEPVAT